MTAVPSLVCFAVKEEAAHFRKLTEGRADIQILLTGMGRVNACKEVEAAFIRRRPSRVVTAGFAGGLIPGLESGAVVFAADQESGLEPALLAAGAKPARFYCSDRVLATAEQKRSLLDKTGAEVVEMESEHIRSLCRSRQVPAATVRVILDTASEDLALDFNQLLTADQRIDALKLALTLLKSPSKISALLRLQKQGASAARRLGDVLARVLSL